jgi:hypothetical protein
LETGRELAMPSKLSVANAEGANVSMSTKPPMNSGEKAAATVRRRTQERRTETLREIREQVADGTLIVRQMTSAERTRAI